MAWTRVAGKTERRGKFDLTSVEVGRGMSRRKLVSFSERKNLGGSSCLLQTS